MCGKTCDKSEVWEEFGNLPSALPNVPSEFTSLYFFAVEVDTWTERDAVLYHANFQLRRQYSGFEMMGNRSAIGLTITMHAIDTKAATLDNRLLLTPGSSEVAPRAEANSVLGGAKFSPSKMVTRHLHL